jgi:hypothetical protein
MINSDIEKTYKGIRQQLHNLQHSYYALRKFTKDKRTIRLVNRTETQSFFTYYVRNLCLIDVISGIIRLTDCAQTMHRNNLTTQQLIGKLKVSGYKVAKLEAIQGELENNRKEIKVYRHKKVAHLDYDTHMQNKDISVNMREISTCVRLICKFLRTVEKIINVNHPLKYNYGDAEIQVAQYVHDVERVMEEALLYRKLLEKRMISIKVMYPEI